LNNLRFEKAIPYAGNTGIRLAVRYSLISYNLWEYDPSSGSYLRFQDNEDRQVGEESYQPLMDSLSGSQIAADNVIVLLVPHEYFIKTNTTEMVKMNFIGQGSAYAFRDGQAQPILWQRPSADKLLFLKYENGNPYPLKPGNSWFEVIGQSSPHDGQASGIWDFQFQIP
jgi:hypothetical protein